MIYLIAVNNQGQWDENTIHEIIKKNSAISTWWHYVPNTYLVKTTLTSKQLADQIISSFPGLLFFITKVDISDVNGVLAKGAWDWIEKNNNNIIKIKTTPKAFVRVIPNHPSQGPFMGPKTITDLLANTHTPKPKTGSDLLDDILGLSNKK